MATIKSYIAKVLFPFIFCWFGACWCIMKLGRGIYWFGNKLSGDRLDPYNWTQEV
jgi:hypothetical protein